MPAHSHYRRFTVAASLTIAAALALTGAPAVAAPTPTPSGDGGAAPQVTPQRRAIELVQPATVLVRTDWKAYVDYGAGRPIPQAWTVVCTGEVVSADGYVVTAGHCLDSGSDGAKRDAIELTVDDLINAGLLNADRRDEVVASVMSGRDRWLVFGKDRDSPPSVEV
jgi:serine protease Do